MLADPLVRERLLERRRSRFTSQACLGKELRPESFSEECFATDLAREHDRCLGVVDGLGQPLT